MASKMVNCMDDSGFEVYLIRNGKADQTRRIYLLLINIVLKECQPLTKETVDAFIVKKLRSISPKTGKLTTPSAVNKYIKALKQYGIYKGLEWTKSYTKMKEVRRTPLTFSDDEIETFVTVKIPHYTKEKQERMDIFWKILSWTGMRPNEVLKLTQATVDLQGKIFIILSDNDIKKGRLVPIAPAIYEDVKKFVSKCSSDKIFDMTNTIYFRDFKIRMEMMGIKRPVVPYGLRHSWVSRNVRLSPLFDVQDIAGHTNPKQTAEYYHNNVEMLHEVMRRDPLNRKYLDPKEILQQKIQKSGLEELKNDKRFNWGIVLEAYALLYKAIIVE